MSAENISFLMKNVDMYFRGRMIATPRNATHMRSVRI